MSAVDYASLIPNNVDLASDRAFAARARGVASEVPRLVARTWVRTAFRTCEVFLRTAVSVDREGWAKFGFVKMPQYRWGILLAPAVPDRKIGFGAHKGEPVWQDVPGEYRACCAG